MSLVGQQALNKIVRQNGIIESDLILNELHKEVRMMLKQDQSDNRDGMDMSVCLYDKQEKILQFAGAKNPLVYIKNKELVHLKGDKHPIGGRQDEDERIFKKHTVAIDEPTTFYMFSDGYQDQFGGAEDRKFMISRMRNLLLEIHQEPLDQQHTILDDTMEDWKKDTKQLDDILVIGFRID